MLFEQKYPLEMSFQMTYSWCFTWEGNLDLRQKALKYIDHWSIANYNKLNQNTRSALQWYFLFRSKWVLYGLGLARRQLNQHYVGL